MTLSTAARSRLALLRAQYRAALPEKLSAIQSDWNAALRRPDCIARRETLRRRVHNLAGSAGLHGFTKLAECACELDRLIDGGSSPIGQRTEIEAAFDSLRNALEDIAVDRGEACATRLADEL